MSGKVAVTRPETGEAGEIEEKDLPLARKAGARPMTDAELAALIESQRRQADIGGDFLAEKVGKVQGLGEAAGLPLVPMAIDTAGLFGKGQETKDWLNKQKNEHPISYEMGDLTGQAGGMAAGGEAIAGEAAEAAAARAPSMLGRIATETAQGAGRGGLENMLVATASDINESALGDHRINGEKVLASAPGHFLWGAAAGGSMSALGEVLSSGMQAGARAGAESAESGANRLLGRELGTSEATAARVRGDFGRVPKSRSEVADFYKTKKDDWLTNVRNTHASDLDSLTKQQAVEREGLSSRVAEERVKNEGIVEQALQDLRDRHDASREQIAGELSKAESVAAEQLRLREENAKQLARLSKDLDNVKGADYPRVGALALASQQIVQDLGRNSDGTGLRAVGQWMSSVRTSYPTGQIPFTRMQEAIDSLESLGAKTRNPTLKKAFGSLRDAAQEEFDRASEATANTVSEASGLSSARLRDMDQQYAAAHENALETIAEHTKAANEFEKQAAAETAEAEGWARQIRKDFEKNSKAQTKEQAKAQKADLKNRPEPTTETPFDELAGIGAPERSAEGAVEAGGSRFSRTAAVGALFALAHGNLASAAMIGAGSAAARLARGESNLMGSRVLAAISDTLKSVDAGIEKGARSAVGTAARETALAGTRAVETGKVEAPKGRLSYEHVSTQVAYNAADPGRIESRVRAQLGPLVQTAPELYASVLESAQRANAFLALAIPPSRQDPYSLTSHLEPDDISEAEKYDYMGYVNAIANPVGVLQQIKTGQVTDREVAAVKEVYPGLYKQMQDAVQRSLAALQRPINYEKSIALGTFLEIPTSTLMEPEFQRAQAAMFAARVKSEQMGGSKPTPAGPNSKMSKASMSGSEKVESGEGY